MDVINDIKLVSSLKEMKHSKLAQQYIKKGIKENEHILKEHMINRKSNKKNQEKYRIKELKK